MPALARILRPKPAAAPSLLQHSRDAAFCSYTEAGFDQAELRVQKSWAASSVYVTRRSFASAWSRRSAATKCSSRSALELDVGLLAADEVEPDPYAWRPRRGCRAHIARATPDGHTPILGHIAMHSMNPALQKLRYDRAADFGPVGLVGWCSRPS